MSADAGKDIHIRIDGRAGRMTLDRPHALNALTYQQVKSISAALHAWRTEPSVELVILDGAGDRALCAGGDVRALYDQRETDPGLAARFWADEYRLNTMIANYPKPYVALMDGIVMGGGIGLSAHGSHRIVTERSRLAMPETTIGLIPDVGGTWLLSRAPGRMGEYLSLTGVTFGASDALYVGFADTHVVSDSLPTLVNKLVQPHGDPVSAAIAEHASAPEAAKHATRQTDVDRLFAEPDVETILDGLASEHEVPWAAEVADLLRTKSPLSLKLTLHAIRSARRMSSLAEALVEEYRLTTRLFQHGEFLEGVRALLVDKDKSPKWPSGDLSAISAEQVAAFFEPIPSGGDLTIPAANA
ncbi:MAG: enoyl-CoA hydratase/isomerase family protein [Pseudomonadota bacterium]